MGSTFCTPQGAAILAETARRGIHAAALDKPCPRLPAGIYQAAPELTTPAGAFVTVYVAGALRGCLGEIDPPDPLAEVVLRCAYRTPRRDYRFEPVGPHELRELSFKLSVLTPPRELDALAEVVIGRDGLIAPWEGQRGLLLPDVATEQGWDVAEFGRAVWRKARIPADIPEEEVRLQRFETQIIPGDAATSLPAELRWE